MGKKTATLDDEHWEAIHRALDYHCESKLGDLTEVNEAHTALKESLVESPSWGR